MTREENYPLLHQNGLIIWLRRDPALLPSEGRPLSQAGDLKEMYREREPLYEHFSDFSAVNDISAASAAGRILAMIKPGRYGANLQ